MKCNYKIKILRHCVLPVDNCDQASNCSAFAGIALELALICIFLFHRGIEIVAKRSLQPLFNVDFIWNLTATAKLLREYNQYARKLFENVPQLHGFLFYGFEITYFCFCYIS